MYSAGTARSELIYFCLSLFQGLIITPKHSILTTSWIDMIYLSNTDRKKYCTRITVIEARRMNKINATRTEMFTVLSRNSYEDAKKQLFDLIPSRPVINGNRTSDVPNFFIL